MPSHSQVFSLSLSHTHTHTTQSLILFIFIELQSNKNSAPYTKSPSSDKQQGGQLTGIPAGHMNTWYMEPKVQTYERAYKLKVQTHTLTTCLHTHKSVVTRNTTHRSASVEIQSGHRNCTAYSVSWLIKTREWRGKVI